MCTVIVVILIVIIVAGIWVREKELDEYKDYVRFLESNLEKIQLYIEPRPFDIYSSTKDKPKCYLKHRSDVRDETYRRTDTITDILRNGSYYKKMHERLTEDTAVLVKEIGVLNQKVYDLENPEERKVPIIDLSAPPKPEAEQALQENCESDVKKAQQDLDK